VQVINKRIKTNNKNKNDDVDNNNDNDNGDNMLMPSIWV
jgi:hypothetical protein